MKVGAMSNFAKGLVMGTILFAAGANASEVNDVVSMVANTKQSTQATVNGFDADVIYVGNFQGCDSVAVQSHGKHFQHFRVCGDRVQSINDVAPKWNDDSSGKRVLSAVVKNAILYGRSQQPDESGYLISARTLGTVEASCKKMEIVISYDGLLVDRAIRKIYG